MCVCCSVACPFLLSEERLGLWWEHSSLIKKGPSELCLFWAASLGPPCPSISWRRCLLSGRRDAAWLCELQADVHHGSEISIQTAGRYLVVVFHCGRCCFLSLVHTFNTTQRLHMLPLTHRDDKAVLPRVTWNLSTELPRVSLDQTL